MKKERTRVVIPHKMVAIEPLVNQIYEKHVADGADSPLKLIEKDVKVDTFKQRIDQIMQLHDEAERLSREMEKFYEQRDILLKPLMKEVRSSAQFLKSLHINNNFEISAWGFDVKHGSTAKKKNTGG